MVIDSIGKFTPSLLDNFPNTLQALPTILPGSFETSSAPGIPNPKQDSVLLPTCQLDIFQPTGQSALANGHDLCYFTMAVTTMA
jgi:hypothetical protein